MRGVNSVGPLLRAGLFLYLCSVLSSFAWARGPFLAAISVEGDLLYSEDGTRVLIDRQVREARLAGRRTVAYIDRDGALRIWREGDRYVLSQRPRRVRTGRDFVAFVEEEGALVVWSHGHPSLLSQGPILELSVEGDALFYQEGDGEFFAWHQGESQRLDFDAPLDFSAHQGKIAWVSRDGGLWAWSPQRLERLTNEHPRHFEMGRDFLAYCEANGGLKIWTPEDSDEIIDVEMPDQVRVGEGILAYSEVQGGLRVWSNRSVDEVDALKPLSFQAGRNLVAWHSQDGQVKVRTQDFTHWLGELGRGQVQVQGRFVAFEDAQRVSKIWHRGQFVESSNQRLRLLGSGVDFVVYEMGYEGVRVWTTTENLTLSETPPERYAGLETSFFFMDRMGRVFSYFEGRLDKVLDGAYERISIGDDDKIRTLLDRSQRRRSQFGSRLGVEG